jgi:glycosyltransferase involved in cell wall biosynthesis
VERALGEARLGDRFHWLPALPEAAAAFAELDVYVLPSRFEGGPYTPLEAMRVQTPVIVTDADGNRDTVEHGVTGLVVPVDDADALGAAITALLVDDERRRAYGAAGRERLETHFDVRAMGRATTRVYNELLTGVARRAGGGDTRFPGSSLATSGLEAGTEEVARVEQTGPDPR